MPNPTGKSNLNFPVPYGGVKERTNLLKSAPISGAPVAGAALNAPRRAQRRAARAARPEPAPPQPGPAAAAAQQTDQPPTATTVAHLWQAAAAEPGASDLVKQYAAQAAKEAGLGQ